MRQLSLCSLALALCVIPGERGRSQTEPPEGFIALFNGKDLTGWQVMGGKEEVWGAESGVLYATGGGGGWLMTQTEYDGFELRLEYRLAKKGNSGVGRRSQTQENLKAAAFALKPDVWLEITIHVTGGKIEVLVDGQNVVTAEDPQPLGPGIITLGTGG